MLRTFTFPLQFEIGIEADLTKDKKLALRSTLNYAYNSNPAVDARTSAHSRIDFNFKTGITYAF